MSDTPGPSKEAIEAGLRALPALDWGDGEDARRSAVEAVVRAANNVDVSRLLDALKALTRAIPPKWKGNEEVNTAWREARAAIAKAEGR